MQPLRGDPDNRLPERTNETDKASTPRLGPPGRPGRWTTSTVFSPKGDPYPAATSLLLFRAGDIESNPGPYCYACGNPVRHGTSATALLHYQLLCRVPQAVHQQRPPPFKPVKPVVVPPHGGPGPPSRQFPPTTNLSDSCRLPICRGTSPLACDTPDCQAQVHAARRCSGAATR